VATAGAYAASAVSYHIVMRTLGLLCVTFAVLACESSSDSGKQRPDTPEGRREFVKIIAKDMPANSMWTEGARSEGLVVDLKDCTMQTLSEFTQRKDMANRLYQFDFQYMKCANGLRVDGPWAHD
jgi:hypothetical protein